MFLKFSSKLVISHNSPIKREIFYIFNKDNATEGVMPPHYLRFNDYADFALENRVDQV